MSEIERHLGDTHFCWIGDFAEDSTFYYRVQSPVVLIEFDQCHIVACVPDQRRAGGSSTSTPSCGRRTRNDYGLDLLRLHYEQSPHHRPPSILTLYGQRGSVCDNSATSSKRRAAAVCCAPPSACACRNPRSPTGCAIWSATLAPSFCNATATVSKLLAGYGKVFIHHAINVLSEINAGVSHLQAVLKAERGQVTFGAPPIISSRLLPPALARFKRDHPFVVVIVNPANLDALMPSLRLAELDFVIAGVGAAEQMAGIQHEVLFQERLRLVARHDHPLAARRRVNAADLQDYPWFIPHPYRDFREQVEELFRAAEPAPFRVISSDPAITSQLPNTCASPMRSRSCRRPSSRRRH